MRVLLYIALGLLWGPLPATATTVKAFVFDNLCETAKTIVHVRCLTKESLILSDRDGIFTTYRFAVVEVVKGQVEDELVLVLPGGKVDGRHMEIAGMPQFTLGEETVLFLSEKDAYGSPWPVGLGQGCYGIQVSDKGERQVVFGQHNPINRAARSKLAVQSKVSLKAFVDTIESVLKTEAQSGDQVQ
ncbi:MAG: hypothetical protein HOE48_14655 [Candidatus Latescibacteria bacterium]|jgi:hypothetical protein|nr:hypothetical protein [Candidatus Latescibacterota bacterium]MBT4139157.1 hypothetical protein [Candidatus Latescibacterota bacterium]MBT5830082.1 hypothetical protein [Candidatus Latescibacterota bacterium]